MIAAVGLVYRLVYTVGMNIYMGSLTDTVARFSRVSQDLDMSLETVD